MILNNFLCTYWPLLAVRWPKGIISQVSILSPGAWKLLEKKNVPLLFFSLGIRGSSSQFLQMSPLFFFLFIPYSIYSIYTSIYTAYSIYTSVSVFPWVNLVALFLPFSKSEKLSLSQRSFNMMIDTSFIFNELLRKYDIFIEIYSYTFYINSINNTFATKAAPDICVPQLRSRE